MRAYADQNGLEGPLSADAIQAAGQAMPALKDVESKLYTLRVELNEMSSVKEARREIMHLTGGSGEVDITMGYNHGVLRDKIAFDSISHNRSTAELIWNLQLLEAAFTKRAARQPEEASTPKRTIGTLYVPASVERAADSAKSTVSENPFVLRDQLSTPM